ncbi:hypothetical protein BKA67DRAFT_660936 [Truncatella angustata]|uniref:Uncharacterized protein n=1 Tax=Truncatella angustata TaxID=152316 RepID=A0A9P8UHH0_9PEZI|nr:uncharacterized protein BKA67DRAFT_660936 [Truncatella angustata]KAH6652174.1 hypothetical protein BKA67DRAFT_660936 [Truncatella angustata]
MATSTSSSASSPTRRNLGPLTTTFTAPSYCNNIVVYGSCSTCDYGWQAQTCANGGAVPVDDSSCWPARTSDPPSITGGPAFHGWGFYSPGVMCPNGYTSACASTVGQDDGFSFQFRLTSSETAIGCCPTGYTCVIQTRDQTCVSVARSTSVLTGTCPGGSSTISYAYKSLPFAYSSSIMDNFTIMAPLFQLVHQPSDTMTTGTPSVISAATTSSTSSSNISGPNVSTGTRLSVGAAVGIGVGIAVAVFLIGLLSYLLWRSQRKRKAHSAQGNGPVTTTTQFPQMQESVYTPESYFYSELPPQDGGKPQELSNIPKGPVELSAGDGNWTRSRSSAEVIDGLRDQQKVLDMGRRAQ